MLEQYEINWRDYYAILGVNPSAEPEVIKAAYNALARKHHPDTGGNAERMKGINEAFEVLSDTAKRARYDDVCRQRRRGPEVTGRRPNTVNTHGTSRAWEQPWPRPAEATPAGEKILPWPSQKWQRVALFCCFPIALFLVFVIHNAIATAVGLFLLAAASYGCARTRCLNNVKRASIFARMTAGFAIVMGLGGMGLAVVAVGMPLSIIGLLIFSHLPGGRS
jgi:hypothetical protein